MYTSYKLTGFCKSGEETPAFTSPGYRALLQPLHYLLSAKTGRNFFDELVRHLYALLQAEYIWLAEAETLPRGLMARVLVSAGIDSAY